MFSSAAVSLSSLYCPMFRSGCGRPRLECRCFARPISSRIGRLRNWMISSWVCRCNGVLFRKAEVGAKTVAVAEWLNAWLELPWPSNVPTPFLWTQTSLRWRLRRRMIACDGTALQVGFDTSILSASSLFLPPTYSPQLGFEMFFCVRGNNVIIKFHPYLGTTLIWCWAWDPESVR